MGVGRKDRRIVGSSIPSVFGQGDSLRVGAVGGTGHGVENLAALKVLVLGRCGFACCRRNLAKVVCLRPAKAWLDQVSLLIRGARYKQGTTYVEISCGLRQMDGWSSWNMVVFSAEFNVVSRELYSHKQNARSITVSASGEVPEVRGGESRIRSCTVQGSIVSWSACVRV